MHNVKVFQLDSTAQDQANDFMPSGFSWQNDEFQHHYNIANVRDMFMSYGNNIIASPMGKAESQGEVDFYAAFLKQYCQRNGGQMRPLCLVFIAKSSILFIIQPAIRCSGYSYIQPPRFDMNVLPNVQEPRSILSLIPKRQNKFLCCFAQAFAQNVNSTTPHRATPIVTDYEVYQTEAQQERFERFCKAPWFPVDESISPLFEAVRAAYQAYLALLDDVNSVAT